MICRLMITAVFFIRIWIMIAKDSIAVQDISKHISKYDWKYIGIYLNTWYIWQEECGAKLFVWRRKEMRMLHLLLFLISSLLLLHLLLLASILCFNILSFLHPLLMYPPLLITRQCIGGVHWLIQSFDQAKTLKFNLPPTNKTRLTQFNSTHVFQHNSLYSKNLMQLIIIDKCKSLKV